MRKMLMRFIFLCSILLMLRSSALEVCEPRVIIAADMESKALGVSLLKEMASLHDTVQTTNGLAISFTIYSSSDASTKLLIPWTNDYKRVYNLAAQAGVRDHKADGIRDIDVVKHETDLLLRFFNSVTTDALVVLLTSSTEATELSANVLSSKASRLSMIVAHDNNSHFADAPPSDSLKFVNIHTAAEAKVSILARYILESRCTDTTFKLSGLPQKSLQSAEDTEVVTSNLSSNVTDELGSTEAMTESHNISPAVAAGSLAAASVGIAALSVFGARWLDTRRRLTDGDAPQPSASRITDVSYNTPLPHTQSQAAESPVQHINFNMF
eukprot:Blabericola_migrator_1__643@NODE_115_length_13846_cov_473_148632_g103_i0_p7_GENE_NODE_115_length_13846_cov_473_148632_g103_i0NODE_115_length_13846_cov_473_148632_g103_i0_p7_ORF_typecomplete_len326_score53_19MYT1/PF08474_11/0_18_NODE_115_length_13846_cov_473_148632_g103_i048335810